MSALSMFLLDDALMIKWKAVPVASLVWFLVLSGLNSLAILHQDVPYGANYHHSLNSTVLLVIDYV